MRKNVFTICCALFSFVLVSCNKNYNSKVLSNEFIPYQKVYFSQDEAYDTDQETGSLIIPDSISYKQAVKDIDNLCYLLQSCYIGYDTMKQKGFDCKAYKKAVLSKCGENVDINDFIDLLGDYLKDYINDGHFYLSYNDKVKSYSPRQVVFFSNTYVKLVNDKYVVFETDDDEVNVGDVYRPKKDSLYLYPSHGRDVYRIGTSVDLRTRKEKENFFYQDELFEPKKFCLPTMGSRANKSIKTEDFT